jgi:hypothetical protein
VAKHPLLTIAGEDVVLPAPSRTPR